jgi:hypothetical protein
MICNEKRRSEMFRLKNQALAWTLLLGSLALVNSVAGAADVLVQYTGHVSLGFSTASNQALAANNNAIPACYADTLAASLVGKSDGDPGAGAMVIGAVDSLTSNIEFDGVVLVDPTVGNPGLQDVVVDDFIGYGGFDVSCVNAIPPGSPIIFLRNQTTDIKWPAMDGRLSEGGGPGLQSATIPWSGTVGATPFGDKSGVNPNYGGGNKQTMGVVVEGANTFGGAAGISASGGIVAGIIQVPAFTKGVLGTIPFNVFAGVGASAATGSNFGTGPTYYSTDSGPYEEVYFNPATSMFLDPVPGGLQFSVAGKAAGMKFTTGSVSFYDAIGQYASTRPPEGGGQSRTTQGINGTLQLVSPWVIYIGPNAGIPGVQIGVAGPAHLDLTFVPEPTTGLAFLSGAALLMGIHWARRRS